MVCLTFAWLLLVFMGGTLKSVIIANVFQMTYLLYGYYTTATTSYDITWTMPHCVLTLRLIGLTWDLYDGSKDKRLLSADQATTALVTCPSLLEVAAHTYFPASFLVGPQFSMRRYLDFVHGRLFPERLPESLVAGFQRGALGLLFVGVYLVSSKFLSDSYLVSDQFDALPFYQKCIYMGLWGKFTLYKYNSCWLIAEGILIISGLSYENGSWGGCCNINVFDYEVSYKFDHLIKAFNINTNKWAAQYVYKRLKFLGNRDVSALSALLFLAVWHGLHSGYYACFSLEFLVNVFEKKMEAVVGRYPRLQEQLDAPIVKPVRLVLMKLYLMVFMGYCLAPFCLLKSFRWWRFFKSTYFMGHVFFGSIHLTAPLLKKILDQVYGKPKKQKEAEPPSEKLEKLE